jgi:hypothetical protein
MEAIATAIRTVKAAGRKISICGRCERIDGISFNPDAVRQKISGNSKTT